ncbi:MAG: FG-GAP repeat protein [Acidobacteriota bacterium]
MSIRVTTSRRYSTSHPFLGSVRLRYLTAALLLITSLFTSAAGALCLPYEHSKLTALDGARNDNLGKAVAVHDGVAVLGAPRDGFDNAGSAYVYVYDGAQWVQDQKLEPSTPSASGLFGTSVAIHQDVIVVGSLEHHPDGTIVTGAAYIFRYNGSDWVEEVKLTHGAPEGRDRFGISVAVHGNTVLVGADGREVDNHDGAGQVSVYEDTGLTWAFTGTLPQLDPSEDAFFGYDVAITDGFIIVGAWEDNDAASNAGSAYIFSKSGGVWSQYQKLVPGSLAGGERFGGAVDISGHRAVVGAQWADPLNQGRGTAFVYELSSLGANWSLEAELMASDAQPYDRLGIDVAISGDHILAGSLDDDPGNLSGAAYLFTRLGGTWSERAKLEASDLQNYDQFGYRLDIDGDWAIVGSPSEDEVAPGAGAAYAYQVGNLTLDVDQSSVAAGDWINFTACGGYNTKEAHFTILEIDGVPIAGDLLSIGFFAADRTWTDSGIVPLDLAGSEVGFGVLTYDEADNVIWSQIERVQIQ